MTLKLMGRQLVVAAVAASLAQELAFPQGTPDLGKLEEVVAAQEQQIAEQHKELARLRAIVDEQRKLLRAAMGAAPVQPQPVAKTIQPEPAKAPPAPGPAQIRSAQTGAENSNLSLNASQEVRFSPSSPTLKLGPADIRLQGYIALAGLFGSANVGGSIGTNFVGIPYPDTPEGNSTEFRLSSQRTRTAIRVDTKMTDAKLAAYLEADFRGTTSGTVAVTSSGFGFRVRQAWIDYQRGKFELSGGQMFSLLTPVRSEVTPDPAQAMMTYAVDAEYVAGLVWNRAPGIRVAYRPHSSVTFAAALENPEQQVGSVVRFPAALASVLNTQYNTGTAELRTPNLAPDTIFKASFNMGPPGRQLHIDSGLVLRFFRSFDPAEPSGHKYATGIGGNLNVGLDITPKLHLVANGFVSSGGGRYIGGLVPDVIVRANGDISPVKAHSWVSGLELAATQRSTFFGYFSGAYLARNTAVDSNGSLVGFGYPGSNAGRRLIQEWTGGWGQLLWASENSGSIQLNSQYAYIRNYPWAAGSGPRKAASHIIFLQGRYNLP